MIFGEAAGNKKSPVPITDFAEKMTRKPAVFAAIQLLCQEKPNYPTK